MSNAGKRATKAKQYRVMPRKVMVFGVFDRLHPGHISFLEQAECHGEVTAVVTRDSIGQLLKGKRPLQHEQIRLLSVKAMHSVHDAVLGDEEQGTYGVLKKHEPDVICLGYDQDALERDLKDRMKNKKIPIAKIVMLKAYFPQKFHTSLLDS